MVRLLNRRFLFGFITIILLLLLNLPHDRPAVGQGAVTPPTPTRSLAEQAGFSWPVLDDLQQKGMRRIGENVGFAAFGHDYRLLSFSPIGAPAGDGDRLDLGTVMLFQLDSKVGSLLWRKDVGGEWPVLEAKHSIISSWPAPGDWERKGQIEFGVLYATGNTCAFSVLDVYVLDSEGTVHSRLKNLVPLGHVIRSVEIQENGPLLLRAEDERARMVLCGIPRMFRFFELRGTTLTDVSTQHQDAYMDMLGQLIYTATTW